MKCLDKERAQPSTRLSTLRVRGTEARRHEGRKGSEPRAQASGSSPYQPEAQARDSSAGVAAGPRTGRWNAGSSAIDIARFRRTDPPSLTRQLRGDLDWIAMKCLDKDRTRRYETANGLATDIQRHLKDEPVEAGPPTAAYRFRKLPAVTRPY